MPYISADGSIIENKSWFRLTIITDIFWNIVNGIALFVQTLINPQASIPKGKYITRNSKPIRNTFNGPKGSNIKTLPKPSCASGS